MAHSDDVHVLSPGLPSELRRIADIVSKEAVGGALLLAVTILSLIAANSPLGDEYEALRGTYAGITIGDWSFKLTLAHWTADGLLAVFFFLAGLELKRELVAGDLSTPSKALVPVAAAVGGVVVPASIYTAINWGAGDAALGGWAIPAATDIAFALAVLAVVGRHLPPVLRTFLLTLAVVDDLIAILIIAIFYTSAVNFGYLAAAMVPLLVYGVVAHRARTLFTKYDGAAWYILLPLAILTWALVYTSGVHATIAGVLLGFAVPVLATNGSVEHGLAETLEHRIRPLSAGVCVPLFAFFSAGVSFAGLRGGLAAFATTVAVGIIVALVVGKTLGITLGTWLVTRLRHASLDPAVTWIDVTGLAALGGIGFTVSLLIAELSFEPEDPMYSTAKAAVLAGSVLASGVGGAVLWARSQHYRRRALAAGAVAEIG